MGQTYLKEFTETNNGDKNTVTGTKIGSDKFAQDVATVEGVPGSGARDARTYTKVTVGNGIGELESIDYKTGGKSGTIISTLTFFYDANSDVTDDEYTFP